MNLSSLPPTTTKKKKRLGRGYGSGKGGHTSSRGQKGQKSRSKIPLTFTGTKIKKSLFKRLPLRRGKGKFKPLKTPPLIVNLKYLNLLKPQTEVTVKTLIQAGIIKEKQAKQAEVKILGMGHISIPLIIKLPISRQAAEKIKKAGGQVVSSPKEQTSAPTSKPQPQPQKSPRAKATK